MSRRRNELTSGFTTIELVVTLIIVAIMAFVAIPRFDALSGYDARGFRDQTVATLRFAQKTALAQRRAVCVAVSSTGVALTIAPNATATNCTGGAALQPPFTPKAGSGLGGSGFTFLRMGETDGSGTLTLTVAGADNILIDATTGYVR